MVECSGLKKDDDVIRFAVFCLIAIVVLITYYPVLYFPPRSDQVLYLAETANKHNAWDLIVGTYDLNRHRVYSPGDEVLFRPLLYMFLGCEEYFFGHQFWSWQFMGIVAHLAVVWVLLRLLWYLSGPWLGFAGAWLFSLSMFNYEQVAWPHLSSYLWMMVFLLLTIEQVVFCLDEDKLAWHRLRRMVICLGIACFIYETVNLFAIWITALLMINFHKDRMRALVLLTPVVLYILFSFYNFVCINHLVLHFKGSNFTLYTLWSVIDVGFWWLYVGIFNAFYGYELALRTMFLPQDVLVFKPLVFYNLKVILELIILFTFVGLMPFNSRRSVQRIKVLALLGGMALIYVVVIVLGRYTESALNSLIRINSYYLYLFWLLIVLMAFSLISKEKGSYFRRICFFLFVISNIALGLFQGKDIYTIASGFGQKSNDTIVLITTLDLLIQTKGSERGFSFYVDPRRSGNFAYSSLEVYKRGDPPGKIYTFAELLYPQYFRPMKSAKYKFLIKTSHGAPNGLIFNGLRNK